MRISDWSSDVCSSDLSTATGAGAVSCSGLHDSNMIGSAHAATVRPNIISLPPSPSPFVFWAQVPDSRGRSSEEHTSELPSLMRISYAVFCLKNKTILRNISPITPSHLVSLMSLSTTPYQPTHD